MSALLLAPQFAAEAQPTGKVYRIGVLGNTRTATVMAVFSEFIAALQAAGWIDGRNVLFDYRWAELQNERFPALAADLVRTNVDLIVVIGGTTAAQAAQKATPSIPILFISAADPVKFGLVDSFAHPGGNVTGLAMPLVDWGKWLELARECVPGVSRVAIIANPTNIVYADYVAQNQAAARRLGLRLQMLPVARADELADAFAAMKRERAAVVVFGPDSFLLSQMKEIMRLAMANRLPVVGPNRSAAELGAMASYGTDFTYMARRAAVYADGILRGAKPANLPIEQPSRFELVVNAKAAKELGLTIPQSLLVRADEVIQ